jgi:tRNA(Ile)-lysidine synthase TilS/MesJ
MKKIKKTMKRCTNCILPTTYPNLTFDNNGTCHLCNNIPDINYLGIDRFKSKVNEIHSLFPDRNKDYDCILAFSGGIDSTYLLYILTKGIGYKVLAYTVDNGFIPDNTIKNIKNITKNLNVDLVIEYSPLTKSNFRHVMNSWIKKPTAPMIGLLCTGCRIGITERLINFSKRRNIPLIIKGETPFDKYQTYKFDIMKNNANSKKFSSFVIGLLKQYLKNPYWLLNLQYIKTEFKEIYYHYYKKIQYNTDRVVIIEPFLTYIKWTEDEAIRTVQKLNWEENNTVNFKSRSDCDLAILKLFLYIELLGFNDKDDTLSAMIRHKQIDRATALKRLEKENNIDILRIRDILVKYGIDYSKFIIALNRVKKQE